MTSLYIVQFAILPENFKPFFLKRDLLCSFLDSYLYFGFLLEHVYMLWCSEDYLFSLFCLCWKTWIPSLSETLHFSVCLFKPKKPSLLWLVSISGSSLFKCLCTIIAERGMTVMENNSPFFYLKNKQTKKNNKSFQKPKSSWQDMFQQIYNPNSGRNNEQHWQPDISI